MIASGAAAPGFNSLIPAPSVPSLISTEPVELLCRASSISSTDSFCFVNTKTGSGWNFLAVFYLKYVQLLPACAGRKIYGDKGYHTALITIKQGPTLRPNIIRSKRNLLLVSPRWCFDKNSENTRGHYMYTSRCTCYTYVWVKHVTLFNHRAKKQRKTIQQGRLLEVRRKPVITSTTSQ